MTKIEYNQIYYAKLINTVQILRKKSKRNNIRYYMAKA